MNQIAAIKWKENKKRVVDAYTRYAADNERHKNALFTEVLRFVKIKMLHLVEFEGVNYLGNGDEVDDHVQDVVVKVLENLDTLRGQDGETFYAWLHRLCFTHAADVFEAKKKAQVRFTTLLVPKRDDDSEDEDDGDDVQDNPLLHGDQGGVDGYVEIPEWITGDDRYICKLIMSGKTYEQIGGFLGISEQAVKDRVYRLRNRSKKIREHQKEEPTRRGRVRVG